MNEITPSRISLRKLSVQTEEGKNILSHASFEIHGGAVLGVYGPNGSGKSTLLKTISQGEGSGLKKTAGEFWFSNLSPVGNGTQLEEINLSDIRDPKKRVNFIVYIGSDFFSPFDLTIRELFEMAATSNSTDLWPSLTSDQRTRIAEVIEELKLTEFLPRLLNTLSDGERQLVMFARGLIQNPKILVLDETFSKLDLDKLMLVGEVLKKWTSLGMTFLVASHDLNFLSEVSDLLMFLKQGQILGVAPVSEMLTPLMLGELYPDRPIQVVRSPESGKNKILY